jgi:hypothetical protein
MSRPIQKPAYYETVAGRARNTCRLLAEQPDLSGAWNLLFEQIQNPRFVISELLQNADDAGATHAEVSVDKEWFIFSHNGQDFNEDQFASLCRFGFSNKRTIHTIGFRGIGFKSTFSLGRTVEVWSPTLGVAFSDDRFIEPRWIHDGRPISDTYIKVRFDRRGAFDDVRSSLEKWKQSPASLLFFNNIRKLTLNGQVIERSESRTRIPHTLAVELKGETKQSLYLLRSDEEPFPPDAIAEIAQTRKISDLHLGGCKVEVVLGIPGDQHLFVVLPTGEPLALPFSVNAPFLLKPDRFDIKPPSTSPTNSWLLERAGRLVAEVVLAWLGNESLSLGKRAEAYRFLPDPQLLGSVGSLPIRDAIIDRLSKRPVILNCYEKLCDPGATSVPAPLFGIWSAKQLRALFCPETQLLSPEIDLNSRLTLVKLGWVLHFSADDVLTRIAALGSLPKPDTWQKLGLLWEFILEHQSKYDFDNSRKRSFPIVPISGQEDLKPASAVVRVSTRTESLSAETIEWLSGRTLVLDSLWPDWLAKVDGKARETLHVLLRALQLHEPTPVNRLVEQTASSVFAREEVTVLECVQLAQLFAALGASTPKGFQFVTRDRYRRTTDQGLVYDAEGQVFDLAPESWTQTHLLHEDYDQFVRCTRADWLKWVSSAASGLNQGFPISPRNHFFFSKSGLLNFLVSRNSAEPSAYYYKRDEFTVRDFTLDKDLVTHWTAIAQKDASVWRKALELILSASNHCWADRLAAVANQDGRENSRTLSCPQITPEWITIFRDKPCLLDVHHQLRHPSELYRRTPDTDALQGSSEFRFVEAEMDVEATRPVLRLLGVLDTPADFNKIIKRLDDLRGAPVSPAVFATVSTFYHVLDRIVARCRPVDRAELETVFTTRPLILAADQSWQTASELSVYPGDEEAPDAASYIHPAFQGLTMWPRVGVPQHPSVAQTLDWLHTLPSGQRLDGSAYKRVRRALARDSLRIWQECGHWMSLDLTWEPVSRFSHRLTMQALAQSGHLMPGVKQRVADLRPVSTHLLGQSPFSGLFELADALETRVTHFAPGRPVQENPLWLVRLADAFRRVKITDTDKQIRVRAAGARLHRTRWQVASVLEVTPYLEQTPAGSASPTKVAWVGHDLYVLGGSAGRLHRPLVEELSRPFDSADLTRAFDSCAGRDEDFIADYLAEHFTLEDIAEFPFDETAASPTPADDDAPVSNPVPSADPLEPQPAPDEQAAAPSPDGETTPEQLQPPSAPAKPRPAPEPSIFDRYAASLGFKTAGNGYAHPSDGRQIIRGESPFHWHLIDARGNCLRRFWTSRDHLENGVQVAADVWSLTLKAPSEITWVVASRDRDLVALTGHELDTQTQNSQLRLYPASYRLLPEGGE